MANESTVYASSVITDDHPWPRTPFIVDFTGDKVRDFKSVSEVMEHVISTGYNPNDSPLRDVVKRLTETGDDAPMPAFHNGPYLSDTRVGWNDGINVLWQFNRDDDIVYPVNQSSERHGLGRVYAQMIERHQQIVWMTFGVPEFSGLLDFYTNAIDVSVANLMRTGGGDLVNDIGSFLGTTAGLAVRIPFMPFIWLKQLASLRTKFSITKYYDFRATMPLYYTAVTSMLTHLATNMGFIGGFSSTDQLTGASGFGPESLPIFLQKSGPDIYKIISQRAEVRLGQNSGNTLVSKTSLDLLKETNWSDAEITAAEELNYSKDGTVDENNRVISGKDWSSNDIHKNSWWGTFLSGVKETAFGGISFVGFRIEKSTDSSESFSNSTGESSIAQKLNSQVSTARDSGFSMAGGKTGIAAADAIIGGAKSFVDSLSTSLSVDSLLNSVTGSAYVDIPEVWQSSSFGKSYSFDLQLRAPYGDPISIFQSIYIPLCMILAAALPRAAGRNAYTSPFLLRAYCKGMFAVPLGIIESLSIRRGSSEFGWNINNLPTQVDISITIKDLSPAMYVAIGSGTLGDELSQIFSQNSSFQEYLMTMAGMGLAERVMFFKNIERKFDVFRNTFRNTYMNPLFWGAKVGDSSLVRGVTAFFPYDAIPRN